MFAVRSFTPLLLAAGLVAACDSHPASPSFDAGVDALSPPVLPRDQNEATLSAQRQSCRFATGAWPAETIGNEYLDHTGFRVPFIVVSPYARPHYVSHTVYDHASITRFIETRFGLPAMTARDANAAVPLDMFDFDNPAYVTPPDITAHTTVDPAVLSRCGQEMAPIGCQ